jgi:hypothetical protein
MSNIKEPYSISVWEEELIPVQDWYVLKEDAAQRLTKEEFLALTEIEKQNYELHTIMEHYEETQGVIIGAHDMDSVYAAVNPILKKNVNGSVDLTFSLYYKVYDPDILDFHINPFTQLLVNEAKVKLNFRGKWYDLVVKNCVEDSTNFMFNYTCKDIYVNELNKNGFKVELDAELENNQGTATQLAETILLDTDWTVDKDHSDILVETKIEPLFVGILNKDVLIKLVNRYAPKDLFDTSDQPETATLSKGSSVLFFYSDVADNKKNPQVLCRFEQKEEDGTMEYKDPIDTPEFYEKDANEDIIINACNYAIEETVLYASAETITSIPNIIENQLSVYNFARGEKVIKSQLSGYDPDLDKFIFKFYKKDANGVADTDKEYYGYCKIDILSSDLAQNYLANSDNFISLDSGWVFEGIPARTTKTKGVEKTAGYSGQLYTMDTELVSENKPEQESVLVLQLKNEGGAEHYPDTKGEFYCNKFETRDGKQVPVEFVEVASAKGDVVEDNIRAAFYENRKNGVDGYLDKTDDEIEDMINEYLLSLRYSVRSRYAINTGIAANRSAIESLTPNEEYMFAVSLGKYIENEDGTTEKEPHYCTLKEVNGETVEEYTEIYYGAKTPTEFYKFSNIYEDDKFAAEAGADALEATDKAMEKNPYKYYLMNPDYKKEYDATYKEFIEARTAEYKGKYLNSINNSSKEGTDNWRAGGSEFKEEFKKHLTDKTSFTYNPPNNTSNNTQWYFCTSIAARLIDYCTNKPEDISVARALYEAFIDRPEGWSEENPRYANEYGYFYGLYPAMAFAVLLIADANGNKWKWEPMGYDDAQYPEFDDLTQDLVIFARSLNESFFGTLYYALRDTFTINTGTILEWNTDLLSYEGLTEEE